MKGTLQIAGRRWRVDFGAPIDISIRLQFNGPQPNAFYLPSATSEAFEAGEFVGSVQKGGKVNVSSVLLSPHGNGTHTECVGHISREPVAVADILQDTLIPSRVISVSPERLGESGDDYEARHDANDQVITRAALESIWEGRPEVPVHALIIRTLPNDVDKRTGVYSGRNPVYLTTSAMTLIRQRGVKHLLVDVPSVDREEDDGLLPNHHIFWDVPLEEHEFENVPSPRTITEMIFVPNAVEDGSYLLSIQIPDFVLDAAPSRPRLFRLRATQ